MSLYYFTMLTFILIIILISLLIRYLLPYLLPKLLMFWVKQQQKANQTRQNQTHKPEGSVSIKYKPPEQKHDKALSKEGDYVDFEEIENNN